LIFNFLVPNIEMDMNAQESPQYYSQRIAENVASQYFSSVGQNCQSTENINLRKEAVKSLRDIYVDIFNAQEKNHSNNPSWWKMQFLESANLLSIEIKNSMEIKESDFQVRFGCNTEIYELTKNVILVGRYDGCDISLASLNERSVSRLHAIIFIFREYGKVLLVDVGSLTGIEMCARSTDTPLVSSLPENRNVIVLALDEFASFQMGSVHFVVNPKDCLCCFSKMRSVRFVCGEINGIKNGCEHYVLCDDCVLKISKCPLCREPILGRIPTIDFRTANM
jgi:hypothetical protein